jgi:hypothetical protein
MYYFWGRVGQVKHHFLIASVTENTKQSTQSERGPKAYRSRVLEIKEKMFKYQ